MAGGVSTPELVAAVADAGGLGFLAAGYKTPGAVRDQVDAVRTATGAPFGVNVLVPGGDEFTTDEGRSELERYRVALVSTAAQYGIVPGSASYDDDHWAEKLEVLAGAGVPYVSFTFGCPDTVTVARLREAGSRVIVTVTSPPEAAIAAAAGADAVCVQGPEAGGHRASFTNEPEAEADTGLLALLTAVRTEVDLPVMAAGGIVDGRGVAAVLAAGACAAQIGTGLLRTPESGARPVHKDALADPAFTTTSVTRAFSGRPARGLTNRFMLDFGTKAPAAYPHVNNATRPVRAAAAGAGDTGLMSLWAGQGYRLAENLPTAQLVRRWAGEAREALSAVSREWPATAQT